MIIEAVNWIEGIRSTVKELYDRPNVLHPSPQELRKTAEQFGVRTRYGNYNFVSSVKNRSAGLTVYIGSPRVAQPRLNDRQKAILKRLSETIQRVHAYLKKASLVCVERTMGDNPYFTPYCTFYVSTHRKEMVRLAYMVCQTLFEPRKGGGPELFIVYIPEWQEKDRQILVFPEVGVTYVLGTDYYGEAKKGFLRMAMWYAKQQGMLGLHAGSKIVYVNREGAIKKIGIIVFGLTATGKTTHICHNHGLDAPGERIEILQDDVVFLKKDGSALGTERGLYLKTEGVAPRTHPIIYKAGMKPDTIFENVMVDYQGNIHYDDYTLTGNGRGIMQRKDLAPYTGPEINLPPASELDSLIILFITRRNTVVPIISKLTPEQAAAAFMLGESIESSGSDPARAGEPVREVGTNPFIIGSQAEEGEWFHDFMKKNCDKVQCYLLNTGGVGEIVEKSQNGVRYVRQPVTRPEIPETASIIRSIVRDTIRWKEEPNFGVLVPTEVEGVDINKFDLSRFYSPDQINFYVEGLKRERREWLEKFDLDEAVLKAFE